MGIKISDRLRTSRGRYPVCDAWILDGEDGRRNIEFGFAQEWAGEHPVTLEDLAGCLRASHDLDPGEICQRIVQFSRKTGPLFGKAACEAVSDWQFAIDAAQEAIRMQEQVNGTRPWASEAERVVKTIVADASGKELFACYNYLLGIGLSKPSGYSASIPDSSWVRTFIGERENDYLFAVRSADDGVEVFDICLVSCEHALSLGLLAQMLCFFNDQPLTRSELLRIGMGQLGGVDVAEVERMAGAFEGGEALRFGEAPIGKADVNQVQRIVQTMAALHLQRVSVDLFKSDGTDDSLAFDTFLNSLWYDFAMRLGAVKVGYCLECGAGFSLTGHRGLSKVYCGDACRTKAKNRREQKKRDDVREMYMAGSSVDEIAAKVFPDKQAHAAKEIVIAELAKWPKLKQAVRAECSTPGAHAFSRRCCDDGVISRRNLEQLERRAEKLSRKLS